MASSRAITQKCCLSQSAELRGRGSFELPEDALWAAKDTKPNANDKSVLQRQPQSGALPLIWKKKNQPCTFHEGTRRSGSWAGSGVPLPGLEPQLCCLPVG